MTHVVYGYKFLVSKQIDEERALGDSLKIVKRKSGYGNQKSSPCLKIAKIFSTVHRMLDT